MQADLDELERVVDSLVKDRDRVRLLEAGCGSMSHIKFHREMYLVGLDISQSQLDRNTLLSEKYLHDIEDDRYPVRDFDLIVCWDVLEHLRHPRRAMENFARVVADDGLILLASPNVMTLRGMIVKLSPHWFHVLFYRYVYGHETAGLEGYWPFKSYHRLAIAPKSILRFARERNLTVEFFRTYDIENPEKERRVFYAFWMIANYVISVCTLGLIKTDKHQSFIILLRKPRSSEPVTKGNIFAG